MGKHKNSLQEEIMVKFMQKHKDVANNVFAGDKVGLDTLWEELAEILNSNGPQKDVAKWKKTWSDWKAKLKKKIVHNNLENESTGGARFNKYVLTPDELLISSVCDLNTPVKVIKTPSVLNTPSLKRQSETTYIGKPKKRVLEPVQTNIVEIERNLCDVSKSLDNFDRTLNSLHDEQKRHNHAVEKILLENNYIKKRQLDIMEIEHKLKLKLKSKA